MAPVLPGLSDSPRQLRAVADAARDAGAVAVRGVPLHLRPGVKEHFSSWLADAHPDLVPHYDRLFAGGPYQPAAERDRIARLLAAGSRAHPTGQQAPPPADPPAAVPVQLRLVP